MVLYEIGTDLIAPRGYFVPQHMASELWRYCETCNHPMDYKDKVLTVKWNGGNDPGDFVCTILGEGAKKRIATDLQARFRDLQTREIVVTNRSMPGMKARGTQYSGEDIVQLGADITIRLDPDRCTLKMDSHTFIPCPECGRTVGDLDGIELRPSDGVPSEPNYRRSVARKDGKGVFLFEDELEGHHFFFLNGPHRLYCTQEVKDFIEQRGYQNAYLVEVGNTIERGIPIPIQFEGSAPASYQPPTSIDHEYMTEPQLFSVLGAQNVPCNAEGIKSFTFEVPRLERDAAESCPISVHDINAYVQVESACGEELPLDWCRTANIEGTRFWLWKVDDNGTTTFVYVYKENGNVGIGMNTASGLSPENFVVLEFLRHKA